MTGPESWDWKAKKWEATSDAAGQWEKRLWFLPWKRAVKAHWNGQGNLLAGQSCDCFQRDGSKQKNKGEPNTIPFPITYLESKLAGNKDFVLHPFEVLFSSVKSATFVWFVLTEVQDGWENTLHSCNAQLACETHYHKIHRWPLKITNSQLSVISSPFPPRMAYMVRLSMFSLPQSCEAQPVRFLAQTQTWVFHLSTALAQGVYQPVINNASLVQNIYALPINHSLRQHTNC